jgi:hypothetical protein
MEWVTGSGELSHRVNSIPWMVCSILRVGDVATNELLSLGFQEY